MEPATPEVSTNAVRILYLCHRLPDAPDKGCKIRAFHQLRRLARHHHVHLLSLDDQPDSARRAGELRERGIEVEVFPLDRSRGWLRAAAALLVPGRPITLGFFDSPSLRRRCAELREAASYDLVMIYSSAMVPYSEPWRDTPRLLDMVDVDSAKWADYARLGSMPLRPAYALEAARLRAYEARVAGEVDRVVVVTRRERELLRAAAPDAEVTTVPNGVDREFFAPLPLARSPVPMLVFTGQMDYFANVDAVRFFAHRCLPRLRRVLPRLELVVVGRAPAPGVRALSELPGVTVTGAVEDVRPFLARAWAFVAPLRIAHGVQNKILEAMASRLPVVCTTAAKGGLAEGGFVTGEDLLAAPPERIADAVNELLADPERGTRMAAAAANKLVLAYDWERNLERFEHLAVAVAHDRRSRLPESAARPALAAEPVARHAVRELSSGGVHALESPRAS